MTPLETAQKRCEEIDAIPEGDRFSEEKHMLALWDELKRVRERLNEIGEVYVYPEGWRCAKEGGSPAIEDFEKIDLSEL
jgi:hypothetical protein